MPTKHETEHKSDGKGSSFNDMNIKYSTTSVNIFSSNQYWYLYTNTNTFKKQAAGLRFFVPSVAFTTEKYH